MRDDPGVLGKHITNKVYVNPSSDGKGCYLTMVMDPVEDEIGQVSVGATIKLALKAFYINDKKDYKSFRIIRLRKERGSSEWTEETAVRISEFELEKIKQFLGLLGTLDFSGARKARIFFESLQLEGFSELIQTTEGKQALRLLSDSPHLHEDIYALQAKKDALSQFREIFRRKCTEPEWQAFFEQNNWIFGHGLKYVFLDKVGPKLEATTTGYTYSTSGKRVDALKRTRAEASQFVLIEIKRSDTPLLREDRYRPGCYQATDELSGAVSQIQKTAFDFARGKFYEPLMSPDGQILDDHVYSVQPETYLVIGNLQQIKENVNMVSCFELYRRNLRSPTILTFDELFFRARCIVENLSNATAESQA